MWIKRTKKIGIWKIMMKYDDEKLVETEKGEWEERDHENSEKAMIKKQIEGGECKKKQEEDEIQKR